MEPVLFSVVVEAPASIRIPVELVAKVDTPVVLSVFSICSVGTTAPDSRWMPVAFAW